MADYKELCVELVNELHGYKVAHPNHDTDLIDRARAELAKPEPEPEITHDGSSNKPTAKELQSLWQACNSPSIFARAVLARWGRPAPAPADGEVAELVVWLRSLEDASVWFESGSPEALKLTRAARRLKPPSLKEQALETIVEMANCMKAGFIPKRSDLDNIRRAIESMPD